MKLSGEGKKETMTWNLGAPSHPVVHEVKENWPPLMRAAGNAVSSGNTRFPSELFIESEGAVQRRVWLQRIFLMTERYKD